MCGERHPPHGGHTCDFRNAHGVPRARSGKRTRSLRRSYPDQSFIAAYSTRNDVPLDYFKCTGWRVPGRPPIARNWLVSSRPTNGLIHLHFTPQHSSSSRGSLLHHFDHLVVGVPICRCRWCGKGAWRCTEGFRGHGCRVLQPFPFYPPPFGVPDLR